MSNKVKQHYVPKFYFKNFSNNKFFNVLNMRHGIKERVPYESQCFKNNFYGKDKKYENELSSYESKWASSIREAILNPENLSNQDKQNIKEFACFQYLRTVAAYNRRKNMLEEMTRTTLPIVCQFNNVEFNDEHVAKFAKDYVEKMESEEDAMKKQIDIAKKACSALYDLRLVLLKNFTKINFITSDNPVIIGNEFQREYGLGFECIGYFMLFPISSKYYVAICDDKIYPALNGKSIFEVDEKLVWQLNRLQYQNSLINVYCSDKTELEILKAETENSFPYIKREMCNYYCNKTNNFLSNECKNQLMQLFKFTLNNINEQILTIAYKQSVEEHLEIFQLHPSCKPFANCLNYNFCRNSTSDKIAQRILLLRFGNSESFLKSINNSAQFSDKEMEKVNKFEEFLFRYNANRL